MSLTKRSMMHESILQELKRLEQSEGDEIILVSKDSDDNKMKILFSSSSISEYQKQQIKEVLENPNSAMTNSNICTIKPALKFQKTLSLSRRSTVDLTTHYKNLLICLSQAICKEVAKQWIKIAEPNKQALYPYKYFNDSKPPWWPSCVNHIEPDHLDKYGRIKVLINILRNPEFPLETLRIRTKVLTFKNLIVHNILDELYYVAAYDRLFYDQFRNQSSFFQNLLETDRPCFDCETINLIVSDVTACHFYPKKTGIVMVSQINKTFLNQTTYSLSEISGNNSSFSTTNVKVKEKDDPNRFQISSNVESPRSKQYLSNELRRTRLKENQELKSKASNNTDTSNLVRNSNLYKTPLIQDELIKDESSPNSTIMKIDLEKNISTDDPLKSPNRDPKENSKDDYRSKDFNSYDHKRDVIQKEHLWDFASKENKYKELPNNIDESGTNKSNYYGDAKTSFLEKYSQYIKKRHSDMLNRNKLSKRNYQDEDNKQDFKIRKANKNQRELQEKMSPLHSLHKWVGDSSENSKYSHLSLNFGELQEDLGLHNEANDLSIISSITNPSSQDDDSRYSRTSPGFDHNDFLEFVDSELVSEDLQAKVASYTPAIDTNEPFIVKNVR